MSEPLNRRTSEPRYSYRNLALWQQAQDFAQDVVELVGQLPSNRSVDQIARQLTRAATSISANIAEGHGRFGIASYRNHLSIAKGSACEADSWLDLLRRLGLIAPAREAELHDRCSRLIAGLVGRMRDLEQLASKSTRDERAGYSLDGLDGSPDVSGSEVPRFRGSES